MSCALRSRRSLSAALCQVEQRLRADLRRHAEGEHRFQVLRLLVFEIALDIGKNGGQPRAPGQLVEPVDELIRPRAERKLQQKVTACAEAEPRQLLII